jgi:hypothetical protein
MSQQYPSVSSSQLTSFRAAKLSDDSLEKPEKPPLVELKNGKLVFRQKPLSLEKLSETMQGASDHLRFGSTSTNYASRNYAVSEHA